MESVLSLFTPSWAVPGTGLKQVIALAEEEFGADALTPQLIDASVSAMPGIFGDYPQPSDKAPCGIFIAVYSILALAHLFIFVKNKSRGHNFYMSFGLMWYCLFRMIGFALRVRWISDLLNFNMGIASVTFSQLPPLYLNVLCMILGHRIFTWRHPETGNSKYFNVAIILIYIFSAPLVAMAIVGQVIPNIYFLTEKHLRICHQVTQAAAVLNLSYATSGIFLVQLAYFFKPGTIDHRMLRMPKAKLVPHLPPVVQPTWIRSAALTYYPRKGEQIPLYRDGPTGKAIRIIPSRETPAGGLCRPYSNDSSSPNNRVPSIRTAVLIVIVVSAIMTMNIVFRTASTFILKPRGGFPGPLNSWIYHNYVYYIWYGAFEAIANVILLLGRVDLRFYIPDMPIKGTGNELEVHQEKQSASVESFQEV
ncbi:hypothetical protein AWJ20_318 [Sugiyamaella lignohabitans]|uniref:Uncharacterized protein n=1 Tax=Sugiyamaella lignohabitans TaxID=796027 RepID=A0A167CTC1_9ASCO|nr:uncharacterized protein AWJ20_318 [Sugiyamaella lignohabitans]ANB12083.1 hypothetical protein AWJ20_318 [Sugiyamaella lignohabitans]